MKKNDFEFYNFEDNSGVEERIDHCSNKNHIQQVAYSTYHSALTQICFTCKCIRTTIEVDLQ